MSIKKLSTQEITHLAFLAQLLLTSEEIKKYQSQLNETLDYVKNLSEIMEEIQTNSAYAQVSFIDTFSDRRVLSPQKALSNAKKKKDNFFIVERIL